MPPGRFYDKYRCASTVLSTSARATRMTPSRATSGPSSPVLDMSASAFQRPHPSAFLSTHRGGGRGPAGLTAAYVPGSRRAQVEVHEGSRVVGGSPHRLSTLVEPAGGPGAASLCHRKTRINDPEERRARTGAPSSPIPASSATTARCCAIRPGRGRGAQGGFIESVRCVLDYGAQQLLPATRGAHPRTGWQRFGRRAYEQFFRDYNEKFFDGRAP